LIMRRSLSRLSVTPPNRGKSYDERRVRIWQRLLGPAVPWLKSSPARLAARRFSKDTRLPVDAIIGNYDALRDEGLSPDAAVAETLDCYPEAGLDAIKAILSYRAAHQLQAQH
jgi:uncharacterized protein (DUF433 family)